MIGAIQINNLKYTLPYNACKTKKYKCPDCQNQVILKKGHIRRIHFSHYNNKNCNYFDHPNESQQHKDAKYKLANWLKNKRKLEICWGWCGNITNFGERCMTHDSNMITDINYNKNDSIIIEYRDKNNKYIADIAVINNNKIKYIFEIKYTHSTKTNVRPEPWFEITTDDILKNQKLSEDKNPITLKCIRNHKNRYCRNCRISYENWPNNLPRLNKKIGCPTWEQERSCIKCGRKRYNPVFHKGFRQICKICLSNYENELKLEFNISYFSFHKKCLINSDSD